MLIRVLLAVRSKRAESRLRTCLAERSVLPAALGRGERLMERLARRGADLVLVRKELLPQPWESTLATLRELPDRTEVIVLVEQEDAAERAALLAAGCLAVVYEGIGDEALADTLRAILRRQRDEAVGRLAAQGPERPARLDDFVSTSPVMVSFLEVARRVVESDSSLLLLGETGVGKERLARAIHSEGPRRSGPFLAVSCAALPETLLESELFGHEEGAFTGATRSRRGLFELAHRGTIFLDEVGEMPLVLQAKLLRVLQEREILPVGGEEPVRVDVRVMAATNRDLAAEVAAGRFRADLFYRLCVVSLTLPPLRERREDIPALVESYVQHFRAKLGRGASSVSPAALDALGRYEWPGNVRELINVIERAVLLGSGAVLEPTDLPPAILGSAAANGRAPEPASAPGAALPAGSLFDQDWSRARAGALSSFERAYFTHLLERTGGRVGEAARRAGIDPRSLYDKLQRMGLRKEVFRR
jgi:DNA-binding NtrC family response regulator